jgi:uncharacterized protein YxjI
MKVKESIGINVDISDEMRLFLRSHLADFKIADCNGDIATAVNGSAVLLNLTYQTGENYSIVIETKDIVQSVLDRIEIERSSIQGDSK